jgi:hypothetical protein
MKNTNVKTATATAKAIIVALPEFDSSATAIGKAYEAFDKASAKLTDTIDFVMNSYIDQCNKAGLGKTKADVDRLGQAIRDSQAVLDIVASGAMEKKTFTEYAQSAMRAFFHGVPFSASLKNDKDMGLPWGGAKGGDKKPSKAGPSTDTTRAALDKTLCKALEQARALGLTEFAADMLDLCIDRLDSFKE